MTIADKPQCEYGVYKKKYSRQHKKILRELGEIATTIMMLEKIYCSCEIESQGTMGWHRLFLPWTRLTFD